MTPYIFLAALGIMLASLAGIIIFSKYIKERVHTHLPYLISFSAGVFLFTAGFLTIESLHILENIFMVTALVLVGYIVALIIDKLLPHFHHHHEEHCDEHSAGKRVLIGDAIHNIADGLILVPAFMVSPWLGLGAAISIFAHEFLQELSEFLVLTSSGYSEKRALAYNFLVSSTIFVGIGIGLVLSQTLVIQGWLLALSAGFFLQLIFSDLLPHNHSENKSKIHIHLVLVIVGVLAIGGINSLFAHSHEHGDHESEELHHDEHDEQNSNEIHDEEHPEDVHIGPDEHDTH